MNCLDYSPVLLADYVTTGNGLKMASTAAYEYRNGLWPMQYVFLIRSSAGGKKYVTRQKFQRYFTQKHGTLFIADVVWT